MKITSIIAQVLVCAVIVAGGLEICLRVYPRAIPLDLLKVFQEEVRLRIAVRLDLPNSHDFLEVARDDGGPLLRRHRPASKIKTLFRDEGAANGVVLDSTGFCNPAAATAREAPIDIVAIGDSFTWCTAVPAEIAWPSQLGALTGYSVDNLGIPGIGLYEYLQILKQFGLQRQPRVVIMNVYEGNDLRDALQYWEHRRKTGGGETPSASAAGQSGWLLRQSYVANVLRAAYSEWLSPLLRRPWREKSASKETLDEIDRDAIDFRYRLRLPSGEMPFNQENGDRDEPMHALVLDQGQIDLAVFDQALKTFSQLAGEHCFTPVLAYSPSAYTANREYVAFSDPDLGAVLERYSSALRGYFRDAAKRYGLAFHDLTPDLRAESAAQGTDATSLLYFPFNVHYAPQGQKVVAQALAAVVKSLPAAPSDKAGGCGKP